MPHIRPIERLPGIEAFAVLHRHSPVGGLDFPFRAHQHRVGRDVLARVAFRTARRMPHPGQPPQPAPCPASSQAVNASSCSSSPGDARRAHRYASAEPWDCFSPEYPLTVWVDSTGGMILSERGPPD